MKLQRKLKKRIIRTLGRAIYKGIITGYLMFEKYSINKGVRVVYSKRFKNDMIGPDNLIGNQIHPYITFKNIYFKGLYKNLIKSALQYQAKS